LVLNSAGVDATVVYMLQCEVYFRINILWDMDSMRNMESE